MKIIFFGSDDFAQAHLEELIAKNFKIVATVTQPDRPKGRGMQLSLSPIKETALKYQMDCLQPDDICDPIFIKQLATYEADLFVVIAYGKFLTRVLLEMPKLGAINVHGSLLPKYRGAAPINWAIINGERETGVTVMYLTKKMDAGDMITSEKCKIAKDDTGGSLRQKMIEAGKKALVNSLMDFSKGNVKSKPQDTTKVTFAPKLTKELGVIDWAQSAEDIERKVRGLHPWPTAYTFIDDKMLKVLSAEVVSGNGMPGEIMAQNKEYMDIGTGKGLLRVHEVHLANSKAMSAAAFLRGQRIEVGAALPYISP